MIDIQIDFNHGAPLYFRNPVSIIQTEQPKEVEACIRQVQSAVDEGFYAAGYVSYEAAHGLRPELSVVGEYKMPLVWFGIFREPTTPPAKMGQAYHLSDWTFSTSAPDYKNNVEDIRRAIARGETYQVNYTMRMEAPFQGHARTLYEHLKRAQPGTYSAFLDTGQQQILSVSPELFFQKKGNHLRTKPMKGTIARGATKQADEYLYEELRHSEKDRAENVMIVDLLRNDLGVIAETGSVHTTDLFAIEAYPTVWQMTSTIDAELKQGIDFAEIFRALFPCGSITGAPKQETMKRIAELENNSRDVYCGSIGYITPAGDSVFNVAIRTAVVDSAKERITYGTGGGVTWDSTPQGEYEEAVLKSKIVTDLKTDFSLLESLRLEDGRYPFLARHCQRMQSSAARFQWSFSAENMQDVLLSFARKHPSGTYKVRLLYHPERGFSIEGAQIQEMSEPVAVELSAMPIAVNDPFSFHKTTARDVFAALHSRAAEDVFDILLYNDKDELLEFTIGNLVLDIDGAYVTPPVSLGLLPGVYRAYLLEQGIVKEQILSIADLEKADRVWLINSVRGWVEVSLKSL
ncbi:aminodeoxychorismate synthase component I [Natribacillus halophilus]|uniref:Aminodeoxychorismate synthase, subunit I /aminodeoxychorismate lyase apoprotein n=1 Tax=Natribacillus halophilus TaxID=549003 RepID=A0A1G8J686_9BACI|nr:aminodeoxychorismate synthase component I [Natribacillus halophilus]SDI26788.1 aminodeoxychorismate synthase, subunit I /aminodeoxychorismate lyase apoprotein [Natribacillus halophilus]